MTSLLRDKVAKKFKTSLRHSLTCYLSYLWSHDSLSITVLSIWGRAPILVTKNSRVLVHIYKFIYHRNFAKATFFRLTIAPKVKLLGTCLFSSEFLGILKEGFWEEAWLCRVRVGFGGREGALASTLIYIMGIIHIYIYIYITNWNS